MFSFVTPLAELRACSKLASWLNSFYSSLQYLIQCSVTRYESSAKKTLLFSSLHWLLTLGGINCQMNI